MTRFASPDPGNVTASNTVFNYSLSSANLFTNATAKWVQPINSTELKFFSSVTDTHTGVGIPNTAINYTVNQTHSPTRYVQKVSWNITVPGSNCGTSCSTFVSFTLFGNLTKGTSENFTVTKGTTQIESGIFQGNDTTFRPICTLAKGNNATVCGPTVRVPVDTYVASNVTLSLSFGWNTTAAGTKLKASVGEIVVESLANTTTSSTNSVMTQTPGNTVTHYATFSSVSYNTTNAVKPWSSEVINLFYPSGYNLTQLQINKTNAPSITIFPLPSPQVSFEKKSCNDGICSQALVALNMSDIVQGNILHGSTIYITAKSGNTVSRVSTLSGGVSTQVFTSGDTISVKVVNEPSIVNGSAVVQTGTLTITFPPALGVLPGVETTAKGGVYDFRLPSNCGSSQPLCATTWNLNVTFTSLYDLGNNTGSFRMDLIQVKSFSASGGTNSLIVQGSLTYGGSGNPASGINGTLVAIDAGTPGSTPLTYNNAFHSPRLYISNVTLVDGAFTQGQTLIVLFTIANNDASQQYNATLTIEHDWPGPQKHNMTASIFLGLGDVLSDLAFSNATSRTYMAKITFTGNGVQVVLTKPFAGSPAKTLLMTLGTSPVVPNRPHAGLFNMTITSQINSVSQSSPNSILSPTYAYIPQSFPPSRYLYAAPSFQTKSDGTFSQTITSNSLLGAKNLTVFVLARDASGIVVVSNTPTSRFTDSTTLIASADSISPVEKGQSGTATLHLTSNSSLSSGITELISIVVIVHGNGITPYAVATKTGVSIAPGASVTVSIPFTAPQNTGTYTLTYSSPEYGSVLTSQTLQVTILQSNLQLLIPAGVAVVAAIIVLGYYLISGRGEKEEVEEVAKPKGPTPKPKTTPGPSSPTKSLTQSRTPF